MIPKRYITHWQSIVPWNSELQVEQDLLISRVLIELYNNELIKNSLAFRGGTALNKLFIQPAARYSEDIDLVQLRAEPIGKVINTIQDILKPLLGNATVKRWQGRVTLIYRFESESDLKLPARLKIEINTQDHFNYQEIISKTHEIDSGWFSGAAEISTYQINELTATKLKALYQRKKGRDLFDMDLLLKHSEFDLHKVIEIFHHYCKQENQKITRALFEENLVSKMNSEMFVRDTAPLLAREIMWDPKKASEKLMTEIIPLLPSWQGLKKI